MRLIAENWENPRVITNNREFILMSGLWKGVTVSICSTGIGVGSTEIAIIELIQSGVKKLVRLGGCGAWQEKFLPGDLMLNHAMVRDPGLLSHYVSDVYPAVADPDLLQKITRQAEGSGFRVHTGIGITTQSYYHGQGRENKIKNGPKLNNDFMPYWQERHITNADMETAVLFLLASLYQIPAANCLVVHVNRLNQKWVSDEDYQGFHQKAAEIVLDACIG